MHEHLTSLTVGEKATEIWQAMDKNARTIIRFGMFPAEVMREAEAEGYNGKDLAVSLMERATADGGMVI